MNKQIYGFKISKTYGIFALLAVVFLIAYASAQYYVGNSSNNSSSNTSMYTTTSASTNNGATPVIIVVGSLSGQSDMDAAKVIATNFNKTTALYSGSNTNGAVIITDTQLPDYLASINSTTNTIRIISIGGSCVNTVTAAALDLPYPTCGLGFTDATNIANGGYVITTIPSPYAPLASTTTPETITVLAGYSATDTMTAATLVNQTSWNRNSATAIYTLNETNMSGTKINSSINSPGNNYNSAEAVGSSSSSSPGY